MTTDSKSSTSPHLLDYQVKNRRSGKLAPSGHQLTNSEIVFHPYLQHETKLYRTKKNRFGLFGI